MGALRATVSVRGREIDILFSHIEFSRKTDNKGRPVTSVIGGRLTFSIEATKDTEILEAMVNSQFKPVSGKIIFYKTDDNSIFRTIEFRCAYIVFTRKYLTWTKGDRSLQQ